MLKIPILDTPGQRRLLLEAGLIGPWTADTGPDGTRPRRTDMSNEKARTAVRMPPRDGEEPNSSVEPARAPTAAESETRRGPVTRGGGGR